MFRIEDISKNEVLLEVQDNLTKETTSEFQEQLDEILKHERDIVLDFSQVDTINSSCLGKILVTKRILFEKGHHVSIRGCSDNLYNTLEMIRLNKLIDIER